MGAIIRFLALVRIARVIAQHQAVVTLVALGAGQVFQVVLKLLMC